MFTSCSRIPVFSNITFGSALFSPYILPPKVPHKFSTPAAILVPLRAAPVIRIGSCIIPPNPRLNHPRTRSAPLASLQNDHSDQKSGTQSVLVQPLFQWA